MAEPPAQGDLPGAALVVLAHNRDDSLRNCLASLTSLVDMRLFQLYVSLDDAVAADRMGQVVRDFATKAQGEPLV